MARKKNQPQKAVDAKICVSIGTESGIEQSVAVAVALAQRQEAMADVLEIRLDSLTAPAITPFGRSLNTPLLFTNRPEWEGGMWSGDEDSRVALLLEAVQASAAYVDIELNASRVLRHVLLDAATQTGTKVIVSWHDFSTTPSAAELQKIVAEQAASGCPIGKIVTMANDYADVQRVLDLVAVARKQGFPLIAFCMGKAGMISRLATLEMGGYMTYAAPNNGSATAPGQLPVSTLRFMMRHPA